MFEYLYPARLAPAPAPALTLALAPPHHTRIRIRSGYDVNLGAERKKFWWHLRRCHTNCFCLFVFGWSRTRIPTRIRERAPFRIHSHESVRAAHPLERRAATRAEPLPTSCETPTPPNSCRFPHQGSHLFRRFQKWKRILRFVPPCTNYFK